VSNVYGALMKRVAFIIWTAGFAGLVPVAPGTAGSVVGLGLLMLVRTVGNDWAELLVLLMVVIVGIWSANVAERHYRREDPGEIVIDEVLSNRCRHMTQEEQKLIYKDLEQEMMEGGSMYEEMIAKLRYKEGNEDLR